MRMLLPAWVDHIKTMVQFKMTSLPVKTICHPAENVNETPAMLPWELNVRHHKLPSN